MSPSYGGSIRTASATTADGSESELRILAAMGPRSPEPAEMKESCGDQDITETTLGELQIFRIKDAPFRDFSFLYN